MVDFMQPRKNKPFRSLLFTLAASAAGTQVATLLISYIAAAKLRWSPSDIGFLVASGRAPFLLFGLLAGWIVDSLPKRRLMLSADLSRSVFIMALVSILALGQLDFITFLILNFIFNAATLLFDVSYSAYLPELVESGALTHGNSRLEAVRTLSMTGAAALTGFMLDATESYWPALVCAMMFAASVAWLAGLPPSQAIRSLGSETIWQRLLGGFTSIRSDYNFMVLCMFGTVWNLIAAIETTLLVLYLDQTLHFTASQIGIGFTILSMAGIPGAYLAPRFRDRLSLRSLTLIAMGLAAFGWLLVATSTGPRADLIVLAGLAITGFFSTIYNVISISYRQAVTPRAYQGRVIAAIRFLMWGTIPIGAIVGGLLAERVGVREAMITAAVLLTLACGVLILMRRPPAAPAFSP